MDQLKPFRCYYCDHHTNSFRDVIEHLEAEHPDDEIKLRKLTHLDKKKVYQTKLLKGYVPAKKRQEGKIIELDERSETILLKHSDVKTPDNESKRQKASAATPRKVWTPLFQDNPGTMVGAESIHVQEVTKQADAVAALDLTDNYENDNEHYRQVIELFPQVLKNFQEAGLYEHYCKFLRLVSEKRFDLRHIFHLLFLDVVEFFSTSNTHAMRYKFPETLKFWRIGNKLFHGKFLRFMGGPKSAGHVVNGNEHDQLKPDAARINFAIPSRSVLDDPTFKIADTNPGIIEPMFEAVVENAKFSNGLKITVDAKKIKKGFGKKRGEVDMDGYEDSPTLAERTLRLQEEIERVQQVNAILTDSERFLKNKLQDINENTKPDLLKRLQELVVIIGKRIMDLRQKKLSTEMSLRKVKGMAGSDWRHSKYVNLISTLQTRRYELSGCINDGLETVNEIAYYGSSINNVQHLYCRDIRIDLSKQANYYELKNPEDIDERITENTAYIKQRSQLWFDLRSTFKVTGSRVNTAVGLDTLKKQQQHFDHVMHGKDLDPIPEKVQENMKFGTDNEINALATLVGRVMPFLFPELVFAEEGCHIVKYNGRDFLLVSPDGSLRQNNPSCSEVAFAWENKCKTDNEYSMPVNYKIPRYYVMQVLSEMAALDTSFLIFTCWSAKSMVVLEVQIDREMFMKAWEHLTIVYDPDVPKRPVKVSLVTKELKQSIPEFCETHVRFLGEFPTLYACRSSAVETGKDKGNPFVEGVQPREPEKDVDFHSVYTSMQKCQRFLNFANDLSRTAASEVLVFMAGDLDRMSGTDSSHSQPIAYYLKGTTLKKETFRAMLNDIWCRLVERSLDVPVICSDGYFFDAFSRDGNGDPLSQLQLMKDVWKGIKKEKKPELLSFLRNFNQAKYPRVTEKRNVPFMISDLEIRNNLGQAIKSTVMHVDMPTPWEDLPQVSPRSLKLILKKDILQEVDTEEDEGITDTAIQEREVIETVLDDLQLPLTDSDEAAVNAVLSSEATTVQTDKVHAHSDCQDVDLSDFLEMEEPMETEETQSPGGNCETSQISSTGDIGATSSVDSSSVTVQEDNAQSSLHGSELETESTVHKCVLSVEDMTLMKQHLMYDDRSKAFKDWSSMSVETFSMLFSSCYTIEENFRLYELKICLKAIAGKLKTEAISFGYSWKKYQLVNLFSKLAGNEGLLKQTTKKGMRSPKSLQNSCLKALKNFSKDALCVIKAEFAWKEKLRDWRASNIFQNVRHIDGFETDIEWFSRPEMMDVRGTKVPRFYLIDAHHILTNLRTKVCTSGLPEIGVCREAWQAAATSKDTKLNYAMVHDLVDKQNNGFARRTFAEDVEVYMNQHGYMREAEFCRLVRTWYESQDEPGIPAKVRIKAMLEMNCYLLRFLDIGQFPPPMSHVKGIPIITFESIVVGNERKIQMYPCVPAGTYNIRSTGSLDVETFFQSFVEMDPGRSGCLDPDVIPMAIQTACYLEIARLDPEKPFEISTHGSSVYPSEVLLPETTKESSNRPDDGCTVPYVQRLATQSIQYRNHAFDRPRRSSRIPKRKKDTISDYQRPSRGEEPVRSLRFRCNERNIMSHVRKGLSDIPYEK